MPTNANTFNSRVTSEALEKKFRDVFPAQGGAELVQDLYASGVVQPVIDFSSVAEGSVLPTLLQNAWDFATTADQINNTTTVVVNNPGFYKVDLTWAYEPSAASATAPLRLEIFDGSTAKPIWGVSGIVLTGVNETVAGGNDTFFVFLRAGDSLRGVSTANLHTLDVFTRQVADVNGNLVNPLGFTFT